MEHMQCNSELLGGLKGLKKGSLDGRRATALGARTFHAGVYRSFPSRHSWSINNAAALENYRVHTYIYLK